MRCGLYSRVSTRDQDNEVQLIQIRQWVAAHGWTVSHEYTDTISGAKFTIPCRWWCFAHLGAYLYRTPPI